MKYILLIYSEENVWPPAEHAVALAESIALCHTLHAQGKYIDAAPLHPVSTATTVRVRQGKRTVSDGPFAETKEHLAGYFVIDVEGPEQAIDIAASIPGTWRGTTEIRPLVALTNLPGSA
jgi:hypothetical protein